MSADVRTRTLKEKVAQAVRILHQHGLIEIFGHVSARVPGTDRVCILGHLHVEGRTLKDVTAEDILTIDLDGQVLEGEESPPGEKYIHTAIYRARPDVMAVAHTHPPVCIAFSVAGREILPVWMWGALFAPSVPVLDFPHQIDNVPAGEAVAQALGSRYALLLQGHGAVNVGRSVEEACVTAINLERTAKIQATAAGLGTPRSLPLDELDNGFTRGIDLEEYVYPAWAFFSGKVDGGARKGG